MLDSAPPVSAGATFEVRREIETWFRGRGLPRFVINHGLVTRLREDPSTLLPSPAALLPWMAVAAAIGTRVLVLFGAFTVLAKILLVGMSVVSSRRLPRFPMLGWVWNELRRQLSQVFMLLIRALPLLLLVVTFLFMQAEVWQLTHSLHGTVLRITLVIFPVVTMLFAAIQLYGNLKELCALGSWQEVVAELRRDRGSGPSDDRPDLGSRDQLVALAERLQARGFEVPAVERRQRMNAAVVMLFVLTLQIVVVSIAVGLFFLLFGMLTITPEITRNWIGPLAEEDPRVVLQVTWWGNPLVLTQELLKVSALITAFSGLYFTFSVLAEERFRKWFLLQLDNSIREAVAVHAVYVTVYWAPAVKRDRDRCQVTFDLPARDRQRAELVLLGGEGDSTTQMYRHSVNRFACTLPLEPERRYRYHYRLDGVVHILGPEGLFHPIADGQDVEHCQLVL